MLALEVVREDDCNTVFFALVNFTTAAHSAYTSSVFAHTRNTLRNSTAAQRKPGKGVKPRMPNYCRAFLKGSCTNDPCKWVHWTQEQVDAEFKKIQEASTKSHS